MQKTLLMSMLFLLCHLLCAQTPYTINYGTSCDPNFVAPGFTGFPGTPTTFVGSTICTDMKTHPAAEVNLKASQEIIINPESAFPIINNTNSHNFHAYIDEQALDIADMIGNWNPSKYHKMEIGVKMPTYLQGLIEDFLIDNQNGLNPYDPDILRLECDFTTNSGTTYTRNGFYYKDFLVNDNLWNEETTDYKFRIRFAPPQVGTYQFKIKVMVYNVEYTNFTGTFNVTNSNSHGHLTTTNTNNTRKFFFEDGTPFFGIGQNLWAGGDGSAAHCVSSGCVSPATYDNLRIWINQLADNGGNFTRLRIDGSQFPVMWPNHQYQDVDLPPDADLSIYLHNYDNNQKHMWELDKTFDLMEEKEIYAILSLLQDQEYKIHSDYGSPPSTDQWALNPFSAILGQGFSNCKSFFNDVNSKLIFKKYLDYVIARWGYSTSLGGWMMINETINVADMATSFDGGGNITSKVGPYSNDLVFRNQVDQWICQMKSYMEPQYPWHPTTTGFTGYDVVNDKYIGRNIPCLNFWSQNDYTAYNDDEIPNIYFLRDWARFQEVKGYFDDNKPFIWGELGMPDNSEEIDRYNDRTFHNANWISVMSGAIGTGMYWNDMDQSGGVNHRVNFNAIKTFADAVDWSQQWIPVSQQWDERFGTTGTNGNKIYTFQSVTPDVKNSIVFSLNNSSHWANDPPSSFAGVTTYSTLLQRQGITANQAVYDIDPSYSSGNPKVTILIQGIHSPYFVDTYKTYGNGGLLMSFLTFSNLFKLSFEQDMTFAINPFNGFPDYAYIVRPYPVFRTMDTLLFNSSDTVTIAPDFINHKQNYNFLYDWGNGVTSNDTIANVYYNQAGTYTITLTVNDLKNDTSAIYKQVVKINSTEEIINESQIILYPNPANNTCFIKYNTDVFTHPTIEVYDQLGKLVLKQVLDGDNQINLSALNSGMYHIKFFGNNYQKNCKLVKE